MNEALYEEYPAAYDALYADKGYDAEVEFVVDRFERCDSDGRRALVVGCGTGEHGRRLVECGFDVTGVDRYAAMVERARTKSDAEFRVDSLPDLDVDGAFDLVWAPFTVVNHLSPDELPDGLRALTDRVAPGGLLVCDSAVLDDAPDHPTLRTHDAADGAYARAFQVEPLEGDRYRWHSVVFAPDGEWFVDAHDLTVPDPAYVRGVLEGQGLAVEIHEGYGPNDRSTSPTVLAEN